jgi:hypothetical protein
MGLWLLVVNVFFLFSGGLGDITCNNGPCVVSVDGADMRSVTSASDPEFVPYTSAVGCLNTVSITFEIGKSITTKPLDMNLCQLLPTGACLNKGKSGDNNWIKVRSDFARLCCSLHPKDRDNAVGNIPQSSPIDPKTCLGYEENGYYDIYRCVHFETSDIETNSSYQSVAKITFIPPFGADLSGSGQREICLELFDDKRTRRPPFCLKIQVHRPSCTDLVFPCVVPLPTLQRCTQWATRPLTPNFCRTA